MSIYLPGPIAAYFTADRQDAEALVRCFTDTAVVKDEGHTYTGLDAIKQWKSEASAKYAYTCEPKAFEEHGGVSVVTSRLTGNFPGSPVDLRFHFRLEGNRIASLEIVP